MASSLFVTYSEFVAGLDFHAANGTERLIINSSEVDELTTISYEEAETYLDPPDVWTGGGWPDGSWGGGGPDYNFDPDDPTDPQAGQFPGGDGEPGTGDGGDQTPGWPDNGTGDPGGNDPDAGDSPGQGDPSDYTPNYLNTVSLRTADLLVSDGNDSGPLAYAVHSSGTYDLYAILLFDGRFGTASGTMVWQKQIGTRSGDTITWGSATTYRYTVTQLSTTSRWIGYVPLGSVTGGVDDGFIQITHKGTDSANTYAPPIDPFWVGVLARS